MKSLTLSLLSVLLVIFTFTSCGKQELFKSEDSIKEELQGTWKLIPIPKYDTLSTGAVIVHEEYWTFDDSKITMVNNGQTGSSNYSVKTTVSKVTFNIEGITPPLTSPARLPRNNGNWQIVSLDDEYLKVGSDLDGVTGLTQLEFEKQ